MTSKLKWKPSRLQQNGQFSFQFQSMMFFLFRHHFNCPGSGSGICIPNTDPDPWDPFQYNPDPKHWTWPLILIRLDSKLNLMDRRRGFLHIFRSPLHLRFKGLLFIALLIVNFSPLSYIMHFYMKNKFLRLISFLFGPKSYLPGAGGIRIHDWINI